MALYQGSISLAKVKDGGSGTSGINTATVYLYKRASSIPSGPINTLRYTFSDHTLTGEASYFNGWKQSINDIGSGNDAIWIIAATATASADDGYDDILTIEWSSAIEMAKNGEDGNPGIDGLNQATVYIYKRAASVSTPSSATYTFLNGSFVVPTGWSATIPSSNVDKDPCWVTSAVAISRDSTAPLNWAEPKKLVEDGAKGEDGFSPTATVTKSGITATITITDKNGTTTQTITDGATGTSYYTYIRYSSKASPTSASDVSDFPTGKAYFGIQTTTSSTAPAWNDSNWHWTKYIGDDGQPGTPGISITGARELYWLKVNINPSQINTSTTIYDTDRQDSWTSVVPSYVANGKYYTCIETSLSNNTKYWSPPIESKGLTDANENAFVANSIAQSAEENALGAISISRATQQYFWRLTQTEGSTVAGSYITEVSEDSFKSNRAAAGGYFLATSTGLELGKGSKKYATLDTSLRFYGSNQTHPLMMLSGTNLTFYKIANNASSEAAILSSNGLAIKDGFLQLGGTDSSSTASGNITLSNVNFSRSINGISRSNLRLAIGGNFGVKNDGTLYASNAHVSGTIEVGSGSNVYTKTEAGNTFDALGAATTEVGKYITTISSNNGIQIHAINNSSTNYTQIDTNGMEIYKNGVSVAKFGTDVVLGQNAVGHSIATLATNGMDIVIKDSANDIQVAHFGYGVGTGASGQAPYYSCGWRDGTIGAWSFVEGKSATVVESGTEHIYQQIASGYCSHVEGSGCQATGSESHAGGFVTTASGDDSFAGGDRSVASGATSFAYGDRVEASRRNQFVIGHYNKIESGDHTSSGTYVFIIGNGDESKTNGRDNIFTVDWNGNVDIHSGAKYKINGTALSASNVGAVPTSRTVNGKALSSNISLTASDVGALATSSVNDYVIAQSSSATSYGDGYWRWREWNSGKVEIWYHGTLTLETITNPIAGVNRSHKWFNLPNSYSLYKCTTIATGMTNGNWVGIGGVRNSSGTVNSEPTRAIEVMAYSVSGAAVTTPMVNLYICGQKTS